MYRDVGHFLNETGISLAKRIAVILAILVTLSLVFGCTVSDEKAQRLLAAEGCTKVKIEGWVMFGCGQDDSQHTSFTCEKNGFPVEGVICGGLMKGYTIRYK